MRSHDYYDILGVPRDATPAQIKLAYRRLAMKYHPDHNPGDASAKAKFQRIREAYEALSDPERRAEYDRNPDRENPEAPGQEPPRPEPPKKKRQSYWEEEERYCQENFTPEAIRVLRIVTPICNIFCYGLILKWIFGFAPAVLGAAVLAVAWYLGGRWSALLIGLLAAAIGYWMAGTTGMQAGDLFASHQSAAYETAGKCPLAKTWADRRICLNPALSSLNQKMEEAYDRLRKQSPRPGSVEKSQRKWHGKLEECMDDACVEILLRQRIRALDRQSAALRGKRAESAASAAGRP